MSVQMRESIRDLFLVVILLIFFSCHCNAEDKTYGNVVVTKVVSVYDGDTFTVDIKEFPSILGESISVRIMGIDTPEMKGDKVNKKLAIEAKMVATQLLMRAKKVELKNIRRDKYFRILADVSADGVDVASEMIKRGLARKYDGGTKEW